MAARTRIAAAGVLPGVFGLFLGCVLQTVMLSLAAVIASLAFVALADKVRLAPVPALG